MSYRLIDHELTPFSPIEQIERVIEELRDALSTQPDDPGLLAALDEVESLLELASVPR